MYQIMKQHLSSVSYTFKFKESCEHHTISLSKGSYLVELWGASGGSNSMYVRFFPGGYGGYTSGILKLNTQTTFYIYT